MTATEKPVGRRSRRASGSVSFPSLCRAVGLPEPLPEHRFEPTRRWQFDWAWPDHKIALEQEGGIWIQGRHSRGSGMVKDFEKYNHAAALGWRVFKATPQQVASGAILDVLKAAIQS